MITKWCVIFSDPVEVWFFLVGPFDSKDEADEYIGKLGCEVVCKISVHPYIKALGWIGKAKQDLIERNYRGDNRKEELSSPA